MFAPAVRDFPNLLDNDTGVAVRILVFCFFFFLIRLEIPISMYILLFH